MKLHLKKMVALVLLIGASVLVNAMPSPPGGSPGGPPGGSPPVGSPPAGGPPCWNPPCVPIDGGIGILLAAGAFVGVRKIYKGTR